MAEPWIRVHANLAAKPIVGRAAEALGVNLHEAMGLLVQFWGAISQHGSNGQVASFSDTQIESWAGWRRKRGRFAAFIRTAHLDANGRVNEWDDYAGRLEQRRATERERLRNKRVPVAQHTANGANGVAQQPTNKGNLLTPARAVRNETKRVTTKARSKTKDSRDTAAGDLNGDVFAPPVDPPKEPADRWLAPICAVWEARNEAGSFAKMAARAAGALAPLKAAGHPISEIAERLECYMASNDAKFWNINAFASTYGQWKPQPIVVDGELTEYGERVTRPAGYRS